MITQAKFVDLQKMFSSTGKPPFGKLLSRYEMLPRYAILSLGRDILFRTRLHRFFRNILISLGIAKPVNRNANWSAALKHVPVPENSKVVIIWACDYPSDADFRRACTALKNRLGGAARLASATSISTVTLTSASSVPSPSSAPVPTSSSDSGSDLFMSPSFESNSESNSESNLTPDSYIPALITNHADFAFYSRLGWLVEYLPNLRGVGEAYDDRKAQYLAWRYRDASVLPLSAGLLTDEQWSQLILKELC